MASLKRYTHQDGSSSSSRTGSKISQPQMSNHRSVQNWEKEFCLQVSGMQWRHFLKAKKYVVPTSKVMLWDDSEGRQCFYYAKYKFWALNYGRTPYYNIQRQNPDKYIDKVDWNCKIDPQVVKELEAALEPVPYVEKVVPIEEIKPTGWNVFEDWQGPKCLTGLIVGDKEEGYCMEQEVNGPTINW